MSEDQPGGSLDPGRLSTSSLDAAMAYHAAGLCVIPLEGKRPALPGWKAYQSTRPGEAELLAWFGKGPRNLGLVCGPVSGNLVVLDFDGPGAYAAFAALFPALANSLTVATGSGQGQHVYLYAEQLPPTTRALDTPIGHLELRAEGTYVAAPPSIHPVTGQPYRVAKALPILRVPDLSDLVTWIESFRKSEPRDWQPPKAPPPVNGGINPEVVSAIAERLRAGRHRERNGWLNCACPYPERHSHGDRNHSFGFNLESGYGYCYRCGTILARELCERLGLDPALHGGLLLRVEPSIQPVNRPAPALVEVQRPEPEPKLPAIASLALPRWLSDYTAWASRVGNQTPVLFHQAAGIWLLSVAVARRLVVAAPWGVRLYPNFYMMLVADTTFYRKTTAYKLAEGVIRQAAPHLLMPTPGSPERFQDALAGRLPGNFKELSYEQQALLNRARAFAAQRGLFKDEVAGLFGSFNKKDYMVGMKDLILELYDCPDYSDKDTQTGLTIVRDAALSILGVTTPAGLSVSIGPGDWDNGLLPRFALLTPEPDYLERPTLERYEPVPDSLVSGLKALHEALPLPTQEGEHWRAGQALQVEAQCWPQVQAYANRLRRLCDPGRETPLDDRLKGLYGRMHVQAIKLATLFSALEWLETDRERAPVIRGETWELAESLSEHWRLSAHRLVEQLDRSGAGRDERRQQDRVLEAVRAAGPGGIALRRMYRNLNLRSADARQIVGELVKDGQLVLRSYEQTETLLAAAYVGGHGSPPTHRLTDSGTSR